MRKSCVMIIGSRQHIAKFIYSKRKQNKKNFFYALKKKGASVVFGKWPSSTMKSV